MNDPPWYSPYGGLPVTVQVLFFVALAVIVISFADVTTLWFASRRQRAHPPPPVDEAGFPWVFVVPALNEELTISDNVARLAAVDATHKIILVVDDGSDDATPDILAASDAADLHVLRREMPDARRGKAAALNMAWQRLHDLLRRPEYARWDPGQVVLVVVDADGRLAPDAPRHFARHFADPRVGGVQALVRIYNRDDPLTWAQDVEFSVFGWIYQVGRTRWGTANMGGNGQANRLAALDSIAPDGVAGVGSGPWRDRLTEDQDVGVRLLQAGWRGAQDTDAVVEQQGIRSVRRLYRQRTRWAQGGWESVALIKGLALAIAATLPYLLYSWMIYPVLLRALARMTMRRSGWAKTAREPVAGIGPTAGEQVEADR